MKLMIVNNECWIKNDAVLPPNFDSMGDDEKWLYVWRNKLIHRFNEPAFIWPDGSKEWFLNGKLHRIDGPAIIKNNGIEFWFLNGKKVDKEIYRKIQNSLKEELLVYMIDPEYRRYLPLIEHRLNQ